MATPKRSPARPAPQTPAHSQTKDQEIVSANWSGPLPPPGALRQFGEIVDGGAERIFALVEKEQAHRIKMERGALYAEIGDTIGGKILGAVMTIAAIGAAAYTSLNGAHWSVSVAIVGVPITALIGLFVRPK